MALKLNESAWRAMQAAWPALLAFALYPLLDHIIVMILGKGEENLTATGAYLIGGEPVGVLYAFLLVACGILLGKHIITKKSINRYAVVQGVLTASGNVIYIWTQGFIDPVFIVAINMLPSFLSVIKDVLRREEKGIIILLQLVASICPIGYLFLESLPNIKGSPMFCIGITLLLTRAYMVYRTEYSEKMAKIEGITGSLLYAYRQVVVWFLSFIIGTILAICTSNLQTSYNLAISCIVSPLAILVSGVMFLSALAGAWKIDSKGSKSVSSILILLNVPVFLSMIISICINMFVKVFADISFGFVATSAISIGIIILCELIQVKRIKK